MTMPNDTFFLLVCRVPRSYLFVDYSSSYIYTIHSAPILCLFPLPIFLVAFWVDKKEVPRT